VLLHRRQLPVAGAVAERQMWVGAEPEDVGQVVVGAVLPPRAPDDLVQAVERMQVLGGVVRKEMNDAVDLVPAATSGDRARIEPEQAQHAVDVDEQQRFVPCLQQLCSDSTDWRRIWAQNAMVTSDVGHQGWNRGRRWLERTRHRDLSSSPAFHLPE
jgi:hypothetical protein